MSLSCTGHALAIALMPRAGCCLTIYASLHSSLVLYLPQPLFPWYFLPFLSPFYGSMVGMAYTLHGMNDIRLPGEFLPCSLLFERDMRSETQSFGPSYRAQGRFSATVHRVKVRCRMQSVLRPGAMT
jgi:hypothetical protein